MIAVQKAVLSLLLNNPELHPDIVLEPLEFTEGDQNTPNIRQVYTACMECIDEGVLPDPVLIAQKTGKPVNYVKRFYGVDYKLDNLEKYISVIRTATIKGEIKRLGLGIAAMSEQEFDPKTAGEKVRQMVGEAKLEQGDIDVSRASFGNILDAVVATAQKNKDIPVEQRSIQTPFYDFNNKIGPLFYGDYTVVAADTGMGKTSLVQDIITRELQQGKKVASFVLEMSKEQVVDRQISKISGLTMRELREGSYFKDPEKHGLYLDAVKELGKYRDSWYIFDAEDNNLLRILAIARKLVLQGVSLVTVDYLQLIEYPKFKDNRALQVGMASQALARFGKSTGDKAHVIALAQLNRKVTDRQDKRPTKGDLKDSSQIEQSADLLLFLYRDKYYDPESPAGDVAELNIAKHRNGELGLIKLLWEGKTTSFKNLEAHPLF